MGQADCHSMTLSQSEASLSCKRRERERARARAHAHTHSQHMHKGTSLAAARLRKAKRLRCTSRPSSDNTALLIPAARIPTLRQFVGVARRECLRKRATQRALQGRSSTAPARRSRAAYSHQEQGERWPMPPVPRLDKPGCAADLRIAGPATSQALAESGCAADFDPRRRRGAGRRRRGAGPRAHAGAERHPGGRVPRPQDGGPARRGRAFEAL